MREEISDEESFSALESAAKCSRLVVVLEWATIACLVVCVSQIIDE
jgi:hypothetical protein